MPIAPDIINLLRRSQAAVHEARERARLARAWDLLRQRDADGNARLPLPYTEAALAEFGAAHQRDPEDLGVVHHLAIGHHARAWDLELQGDGRAAAEWERALGFWRVLAASAEFWGSLKAKLHACDPAADPAPLLALRQNLLEHLLDIHVDFIRHYTESNALERAAIHMEIVRRSQLPPGLKKRMVGKTFDAMTGSLPEAKAARAFESGLTILERFLTLFSEHLPALRSYTEFAQAWLASLSYQDHWEQILRAVERIQSNAQRLAAHSELASDPLAGTALEALAQTVIERGLDRGKSHLAKARPGLLPVSDRDEARRAFALGIRFGRMVRAHFATGATAKFFFGLCLFHDSECLWAELVEADQSGVSRTVKCATHVRLCLSAIALLEELLGLQLDHAELKSATTENLRIFRDSLATAETEQRLRQASGHPGGSL